MGGGGGACASDICRMLSKFKMTSRGQLKFFVNAKTLKIKVRNYSNFTITLPMLWRYARDFFLKSLTEIQNGRHGSISIFLWAQKLKKLVWSIFSNFYITFLVTRGCVSDFLKMLLKFIMAATRQL